MDVEDEAVHHHPHAAAVVGRRFAWGESGAHPFEHGFVFGLLCFFWHG
jgi:hypothetical protein